MKSDSDKEIESEDEFIENDDDDDISANYENIRKISKYILHQYGLLDKIENNLFTNADYETLRSAISSDNAYNNIKAFKLWILQLILCFNHN